MDDRYDVIVVGAGNAGLSAAAATSKGGLKTLLLERNILPGGCATSFCRGRFEFEASLHELANVGTKEQNGSIRRLFDSLGADVGWCTEQTAFRVLADGHGGYDATMPSRHGSLLR
ncbi:MAG: FAD-dependent oxidoreductase [Clostridia bacterium]